MLRNCFFILADADEGQSLNYKPWKFQNGTLSKQLCQEDNNLNLFGLEAKYFPLKKYQYL